MPIPMPRLSGEILSEGLSEFFKNKMAQRLAQQKMAQERELKQQEYNINEPLRKAQTEQARAAAKKSNMISQMFDLAQKKQGEVKQGEGKTGTSGLNANTALLMSGALNLPTQVVGGNIITPFGTFNVGETPEQTRKAETQKTTGTKTLEETAKSSLTSLPVNASFAALDKLMESPNYEKIAGTLEGKVINAQPLGIPVGSYLQKAFPKTFSKEDADLAGQVQAHFGNIVQGVASKFKGPFKDMINGIINNMKPNMGDSKATQQGKIKTLRQLSELADKQNEMIAKDVSNGMESTAAILKSSKELMPEFKRLISNETASSQNDIELPPREDLEHTAKLHNISVDEVIKRYKAKRGR